MKLSVALGGLILGLACGSAYAVTAGKNAPAAPVPVTSDDNAATDAAATPAPDENPYSAIIRGNVFHLTEPPKPVEKQNEALLALPKVNISGFKHREGEPVRALFATVPKDPVKDPARYFNLAEGEKDGILEVKHIDPNEEYVEVIVDNTPMTLTVKSNSFVMPLPVQKPGINPATANPGLVARPPQPMPAPVVAPVQSPIYNQGNSGVIVAGGGGAPVASAPTFVGGNPQANYGGNSYVPQNNGGNPGAPGGDPGLRSIPTRTTRTPNFPPQYQPQSLPEAIVHSQVYNAINEQGNLGGPPAPE